MSMGFLVKPGQPLIWRGPMLNSAIRQFLSDVDWGELDYLIVDLPPGTGDASLSLAQILPSFRCGDRNPCRKLSQSKMPAAVLACSAPWKCPYWVLSKICEVNFFGSGGGEDLARIAKVPFLGAIPMEQSVRIGGDIGQPVVVSQPKFKFSQSTSRPLQVGGCSNQCRGFKPNTFHHKD